MQKITPFRLWLHNIWVENCAEHDGFGELPYSMSEYWRRYKHWLRREYRYQISLPAKKPPVIRSIKHYHGDVSAH